MTKRILAVASLAMMLLGCTPPPKKTANRPIDPATMIAPESEDWDVPPRLISGKSPIYPISQALSYKEGACVIIYTIGTDGKTKDFVVQSTTNTLFADHAIIALGKWLFKPAQKDGVVVEARIRQEFTYGSK